MGLSPLPARQPVVGRRPRRSPSGVGALGAMPTLAVGMLLRSTVHMPTASVGMAPNIDDLRAKSGTENALAATSFPRSYHL